MKRPFKLTAPRALESAEQAALFSYAGMQARNDPRWRMLFSIPNGTSASSMAEAVKAKREGRRKGVPDAFLAVPVVREIERMDGCVECERHAGLFIEMKRKGGVNSDVKKEQQEWISELRHHGYKAEVAFGWEHAVSIITAYLDLPNE